MPACRPPAAGITVDCSSYNGSLALCLACGCTWDIARDSCVGIQNCTVIENDQICLECGCSWACSGTPRSCSAFTTMGPCNSQDGCHWSVCQMTLHTCS